MKTYIVIHNLNSRGKNLSQEYIEALFNSKNIPFLYYSTSTIDELNNVIVKYSDSNKFQYCAVGGDGSLNSLINALMNNGIKKPDVSCLPAGSGSDFIRTFALPQNIEEAINHLTTDSYYEVDVGRVVAENKSKYFVNVLNIGFLASSVEVSEKMPKLIRRFRYPISFWIKIIFAKAEKISINLGNLDFNNNAFNVCVCNAQYFGGGWNISPKSSLQDGKFNVQIFAVSKLKAMKIFFLAQKGLHLNESDVIVRKASKIELKSNEPIEIDGDYFANGPANIFIEKSAIRFKI
jgi:diacylglycerol kinase (ATP)